MKPRVAYLLKKFPRLSETFVLNEILGQEGLGLDVHVLSRREPDEEPEHPQLATLRADVEIMPHSRSIDPWQTLFSETLDSESVFGKVGRLVKEARAWQHERFPSLLTEALYLRERTEELGIQHVHAHFATDAAMVAMLLSDLGGPTYSITAHAKDIYRSTVRPALLDRMFQNASFVVTVCDANREYLRGILTEDGFQRVRRLYNGIDLSAFSYEPEDREEGHVLAVGRLVAKKGFDVLLEAVALLRERNVTPRVSIAGTGEEEEALRARTRALDLEDSVRFLGPLDQAEVRTLMKRATLLCAPCVIGPDGNRDALPTVLLEALACGLPCISTPVTGIPEILDQGRAGVLVPERDAAATADAIERLLVDPDRRRELAANGRRHCERLFDWHSSAETLNAWFGEALAAAPAPCA